MVSEPSESPSPARSPSSLEALQAWALLFPAVVLVWPSLRGDPTPLPSACGLAGLATLPAALILIARGPALRLSGMALFLVPLGLAVTFAKVAGDTFEAKRAALSLATGLVLLLGGSSLGPRGRLVLARGLALLSFAWVAGAVIDTWLAPERRFAGVLENTGDLSEAALPGALAALALFKERLPLRWIGLAAAGAYVLYAGLVPVYAGALGFMSAAVLVIVLSMRDPEARRRRYVAAFLTLVLVIALGARRGLEATAQEAPSSSAAAERVLDSAGGFEVRRLIWKQVPALIADSPWIGVGPGQFESAFPPYRDPAEIELSTHGRTEPTPVDVEHPHNDWLLAFAEYGLLGGSAMALFLLWILGRALRAVGQAEAARAGLGAAAIGVLVNAAFNGPLLAGLGSAPVAFAIFGALCASDAKGRSRRLLPALAAFPLLYYTPQAFAFVQHGAAMRDVVAAPVVERDGTLGQDAADVRPALERALAACPDSVAALVKFAKTETDLTQRLATWERVLALRPHRFEARLGAGTMHAASGRFNEAREQYELARALDPNHPGLRKNLLRLALDSGDVAIAAEALAAESALDERWLTETGSEYLLRGRLRTGLLLLQHVDPRYVVADGDAADALSREFRAAGRPLLADAFDALKHHLWARSHARDARYADAVRSYFQSLRVSRTYPWGEARSVRLEYAAALVRSNREAEAGEALLGLEPTVRELASLPEWAGQALIEAGLLAAARGQ